MFTAFGDCTKCAGSGVGPLRVLIHTTDEHPPIDSLIDFAHNAGYEMRDDMEHLSVWTSPVHGEKKLAGRVMLGAVVAIATITGSHEAKLAQNAGGFHATCCGNSDVPFLPTHHWLVGSVRPITPIPWKPEQSIDCETGALNPVWRVPTELAEQVTT